MTPSLTRVWNAATSPVVFAHRYGHTFFLRYHLGMD